MRKFALAIAAVAALSGTAPAEAAVLTTNYVIETVDAGSGTFSIDFDTVALTFSLSALNYTLGATTFNTINASMQPAGSSFWIGGNVNGPDVVSGLANADDFSFRWSPGLGAPTTFTYDIGGDIFGDRTTQAVYLPVVVGQPGGVPEPATWAMMLLGFGGIGVAVGRRKAAALA